MAPILRRLGGTALAIAILGGARAGDLQISWPPVDPDMLALDQTTAYVLEHAGADGKYTNLVILPTTATNYLATNLLMGVHSFAVCSSNSAGLVTPLELSATGTTNYVWAPRSPTNIIIQAVAPGSVTLTFQLQ